MKSHAFLILLSLIGTEAFASPEIKEFDSKGLRSVALENISGKIVISATAAATSSVLATKNKFSDKCRMSIERAGHKLIAKVEKVRSLFSTQECEVDFQVSVPKTVDLDLEVDSGSLTIIGTQGELTFKVGSGDITADGTFKKIDGKSGSGNVTVKGLTGSGELKTGSGDINLSYSEITSKGELDLKTGSGDATLVFPKGTKLKTTFKTGSGEIINELGDSPEALFKVSMKAGSGDLRIKTY